MKFLNTWRHSENFRHVSISVSFSFQYKLCRVRKVGVALKGVPYITTHDGRTIRYPDPLVKVNDTVMVDIATGKIKDFIKFDSGIIILIKISLEVRKS